MTESSERAVPDLNPQGSGETGIGPACCSQLTGKNQSAAGMAQHPGAAQLSEEAIILKCFMFRQRGLSYLMISRRLAELYNVHRSPDCIKGWLTGRVAKAARVAA